MQSTVKTFSSIQEIFMKSILGIIQITLQFSYSKNIHHSSCKWRSDYKFGKVIMLVAYMNWIF